MVADITAQFGEGIVILRGPLARPTLRIQVIRLSDQAERLAWLAEHIEKLPGTGIIYCLTTADCERVSNWLQLQGIDCLAYFASLETDEKVAREQMLLKNEVKGLAATVALGMGYDKPDLGFVVHYQRPGSVVAYYQQIGRAGRAVEDAYAVLMNGEEDDEIQEYFIRTAFPEAERAIEVKMALLSEAEGLSLSEIQALVNMPEGRIRQCLKLMEVEGAVERRDRSYACTDPSWQPDNARSERRVSQRWRELQRMKDFVSSDRCLMEFVSRDLDDPHAQPCGQCAVCDGPFVPTTVSDETVCEAISFLRRDARPLEPRQKWLTGFGALFRGTIALEERNAEGRALCVYGDAGWGRAVALGKYEQGHYGDDLVEASADMIRGVWQPSPFPAWFTCVPSLRHPELVPDFAARLAVALGLPFRSALVKTRPTEEQKAMENSAHQLANVADSLSARAEHVLHGPVLLVDDITGSGWTMAVCGALLRRAGSGIVYPFALAKASPRS